MLPICMVCLPNYLIIHQHLYVLMSRNPFYMECRKACFIPSYSLINMKMEASSIISSIYFFHKFTSVHFSKNLCFQLSYIGSGSVFSFRRQHPDLFHNFLGYHLLCKIWQDGPNRSKSVIQEQERNMKVFLTDTESALLSEERKTLGRKH